MNGNENYVEIEVTIPTRIQYSAVRLRASRAVAPGESREQAWDALADELKEMAAREAERVANFLKPQGATSGEAGRRS